MRRVLVIGSGGAGKSHFAKQLGERTGLPVTHLDALYWQPGWVPQAPEPWHAQVTEVLAGDRWILDGNYGGTLGLRLAACDTVVFLDLPRRVCLGRVLRRWFSYRGRSRPDMRPDCPEQLTWEFLHWIWTYPKVRRPAVLRRLDEVGPAVRVVRLRSVGAVTAFLAALEGALA
jgi:adenylate kinase family enzyme